MDARDDTHVYQAVNQHDYVEATVCHLLDQLLKRTRSTINSSGLSRGNSFIILFTN